MFVIETLLGVDEMNRKIHKITGKNSEIGSLDENLFCESCEGEIEEGKPHVRLEMLGVEDPIFICPACIANMNAALVQMSCKHCGRHGGKDEQKS